jgi:pyruvate formate lyase activating enzyme
MNQHALPTLSPVYGYLRSPTLVDFPGHLAAIFFVSGCNFRCGFCHNAALLAQRRQGMAWAKLAAACREFQSDWVDAAVVSGGEPTLHDDVADLIRYFRSLGWAIKLDTNGSRPDVLRKWLPEVDYVAMDIKAGRSEHARLTGHDRYEDVIESIDLIKKQAADYEFRTTVIEAFHTEEQMVEIGRHIEGARRYVLQPFVPRGDLIDAELRRVPRTSPDYLSALRTLMEAHAEEVILRGAQDKGST